MTLIVGLVCEDGVIMGADGAATLGSDLPLQATVRLKCKKLQISTPHMIVGVGGDIALGQQIHFALRQLGKSFPWESLSEPEEAAHLLSEHIRPRIRASIQVLKDMPEKMHDEYVYKASAGTLVAIALKNKLSLIRFGMTADAMIALPEIPFINLGSGQHSADSFMSFLQKVFWPHRLPTLTEGLFAAYWTLSRAVEIEPAYVSAPIQMVLLSRNSENVYEAKEIDTETLRELDLQTQEAERYFAMFQCSMPSFIISDTA